MIVDFHAHVFPPRIIERRAQYIEQDATFREMYANPKAKLASANELLASMERSGVDVVVAVGFGWSDAETCREHNDYLLEAADRSGGRIVAFGCVGGDAATAAAEAGRVLEAGARGIGELRPDSQGMEMSAGGAMDAVAALAAEAGVPLLLHVSEPVGHAYPGKSGLAVDALVDLAARWPALRIVAAHWGGGLPFYTLMPEVRAALQNTSFDTAASSLLYDPKVYRVAADLVGAERILFGSDFPLQSQKRCIERVEEAPLSAEERSLVLGENARRLLGL